MTDRKIARITFEGRQGVGKTILLKFMSRFLHDKGAVILGASDMDGREALLADITDFEIEKLAAYGAAHAERHGVDPFTSPIRSPGDIVGASERVQMLEPAEPVGFLPFHDVLMRQIAAKVGVPFEGLGHTVPAAKDHHVPQSIAADLIAARNGQARPIAKHPLMGAPYGGTVDPQPGGVCGDGPGDASASGDIGIERGSYVEATIPLGSNGAPIGDPVVTRVDPPTQIGELSPPDVQERAWNAWLGAHASGLTAAGHVHALREIVQTLYPSTEHTIPSGPDLVQSIRDQLLVEIAREGLYRLIEDAIVNRCITTFLDHGYEIKVMDDFEDGEEAQGYTRDRALLLKAMRSTAGDMLVLRHPEGGASRPWISFVWGNGVDVIHDYSARQYEHPIAGMSTMLESVLPFAESLDDRKAS